MDGIDAALVEISGTGCHVVDSLEHPFPAKLRQQVADLCTPGDNEIDKLGVIDRQLGECFAVAANELVSTNKLQPSDIAAIGSHGQTIRHRPGATKPFTLQIGDPNTIAEQTGITTIADFRRRDMVAGGQGAPLAPAFHQFAFGCHQHNRVIVNIGGIANITPLIKGKATAGFDTGPGNTLLDSWIYQTLGETFDRDGQWAASGEVISNLLNQLITDPYFSSPAPKSTGKEYFNPTWIEQHLTGTDYHPANVQATLLELTAKTIAHDIIQLNEKIHEVYICGGGAYNKQLIQKLKTFLSPRLVTDTSSLEIPPETVEAAAFAWLAKQTLTGLSGNIPKATGASKHCILGAIYPA